jgi:hypothetical protein
MREVRDPKAVLHTAARRYLLDRHQDWVESYSRVPNGGRADDGHHYRDDAKDVFPRYNVLDAIRVEVERLDPDDLPEVDTLVERLTHAGYYGDSFMTTGKFGDIESRAMNDERERFLAWVEQSAQQLPPSIEGLPYRRTLSEDEVRHWWGQVEGRWPIEHGGWWAPINDYASGNPFALDARAFWDSDGAEGPATMAVRSGLDEIGVRRVVELREYGASYEVELDALYPTYNGAEGTFTSDGLDWLIFASHESATAIGGAIVDPLKRVWPSWADALWKGWE